MAKRDRWSLQADGGGADAGWRHSRHRPDAKALALLSRYRTHRPPVLSLPFASPFGAPPRATRLVRDLGPRGTHVVFPLFRNPLMIAQARVSRGNLNITRPRP